MRRLSMKSKRRKSETMSDNSSEENGVSPSTSDNDELKKGRDDEIKKGKDEEYMDNSRKGTPRKRQSRGRHNVKEVDESEDDRTTEEDENKNTGKGGANKRLKKEDLKESPSIKKDGNVEKEYEVQKIVGQRTIKGRRQFLVRWKGYDEDSDTWEQEKDLNCPELIEDFLAEEESQSDEDKSKKTDTLSKASKTKSPKVDRKSKKSKVNLKKQIANDVETADSDEEKSDENEQKEFEVEKIIEVHFKKNKTRQFLIRWKGFTAADDTWEPEENLNCPELIEKFMQKVEKAKTTDLRELRANRPHTKRYTLTTHDSGRRLSRRNMDKQRATYHECDE
ncbi:PREDICTED: chromobox protein homolog 1 [Dufourea novaeangliae]|uniref:chromobox protein homolog 1 n=1 Tax=Dufourea novaeangliae TaxID=178035 RepID=UPI000766F34B|nr:PREDICTED: chromobox protein homolog 1 [Dufourea novaeangliae]